MVSKLVFFSIWLTGMITGAPLFDIELKIHLTLLVSDIMVTFFLSFAIDNCLVFLIKKTG